MPTGSELYLGFIGLQALQSSLHSLGVKYVHDEKNGIIDFDDDNAVLGGLNASLVAAHKAALEEIGMTIMDPSKIERSDGRAVKANPDYVYVLGTDGTVRQTSIWGLEIDYDRHEMGHEPEDVLVGVSLISRYFPVFLDWNKAHGGSGDTVVLTPDVLKNIEVARKHIAKALPFIQDAPIIFRERFY